MPTHPAVEVRALTTADMPEFVRAFQRGFLLSRHLSDEQAAGTLEYMGADDPARAIGAFDGERVVGTYRSMPREMTVPGGGTVDAFGITNVSVTSTHRRRGLLNRMMALGLADAVRRGAPVATLISAEYPIYGRYGFGAAACVTSWEIDLATARVPRQGPFDDDGTVELVTGAQVRAEGPALFDRVRPSLPGTSRREEDWWRQLTGDLRHPLHPYAEPFHAAYRDASGRLDGLMTYAVDGGSWAGKRPDNTLGVRQADFATAPARAALWRHALSVDWVQRLRTGFRAPDDVLPLLLGDPRAARVTAAADHLWVRVLDVAAALSARTYGTTGTLVLRVDDPDGHAAGTWRLDASPEPGASTVTPVTTAPDVTLAVDALGTLYLGDESALRLAALGRLTEHHPGAAARTDGLLRGPGRAWCVDTF